MNEIFPNQQSKRRSPRLLFPLALALLLGCLLATAPRPRSAAASGADSWRGPEEEVMTITAPQIAGAQLSGSCPSRCSVPITINSVENLLTTDGRKVKVNWRVGEIPADLKVGGVSVGVQVTLDNDKTLDGTASVSLSATSVTIPVKGGLLNLNKGRREEVKKTKVTVTVISNLKEGLGRAQNIKTSIVGGGFDVSWDFTNSPCDTAKKFEVVVKQRPISVFGNRGKERVSILERKAFVRVIGSDLRPGAKDIETTVTPIERSSVICSASRVFN